MMNSGLVVLNVVAKPKGQTWNRVKEFVLGKRCATCQRIQGDENNETHFRGDLRNGNCPRCNSGYLREMAPLDDRELAQYVDDKVRDGLYVPRELRTEILREHRYAKVVAGLRGRK